ncbi:MAG: glycosyltransferase [Bacteroidaceae bacterium]|nr:glycosyltransferase [Bacteroidaceae bacterium]
MSSNRLSIETLQGDLILKPAVEGTASDPVVSVVTVCFNPLKDGREELFVKNLDSVQEQTGVTVEHIVVDGASTDGTLDLVRQYDNPHHEIRLFSKADSGIYEAMNRGIALARGKYITFLNTDDFYHQSNGLALSVKALKESNCSFSFAPIQPTGSRFRHRLHRHPESHLHRFFLFCTIPHPSMLFLKSSLMEIDGYDCSYQLAADYDMMLRLVAAKHRACFVNQAFVTFSSDGFSNKNRELNLREKELIVRNFHRKAFGVEFSNQETEMLVKHYRYPRRYLSVYVESQKMINSTFVGVPQSLWQKIVQCFNFWKYYFKCLLSI